VGQPWYVGRNSLNRLPLRIAQQYQHIFSAQKFSRWQCGTIFIRLAIVASQTCQLAQNSEKIWTYSSSRSSKVHDFNTNWKRICDFLLVINSNFGPILHLFWDMATYWAENCAFLIPLSYSAPPLPVFPLEFHGAVKRQENNHAATLWWRLRDPNFNRLWLIHPCDGQTDRRTGDSI